MAAKATDLMVDLVISGLFSREKIKKFWHQKIKFDVLGISIA